MLNKRICTLIILIIVQVILVSCQQAFQPSFECTDEIGCVTIQPEDPIKIGVLQALSGGAIILGTTQLRSAELAVEARGNELLGHQIVLQSEDSLCTAEGGANAALKIVADPQIVGILGPSCSGAAVEAGRIMSEAGLVMIASSTSAPSLTSVGGQQGEDWQPGYFRTMSNDALLGQVVATFSLEELGLAKAAVIDDGDPYSEALTAEFTQAFSEQGGDVVLSATVNKGDVDMIPVLTAVANSGAELLFFPIFSPEGDLIVQQAGELPDLEDIALIGGAVLILDTFIENVGEAGIGTYFVSVAPAVGEAAKELAKEYEADYGETPPSHTYTFAYDAANLLFNAIEEVAIVEDNGTLHIGRQALRDALYSTRLEGVIGTLDCDKFGDCNTPAFNVVQLDDSVTNVEELRANIVYTFKSEQ